jgi:hypothetical protein
MAERKCRRLEWDSEDGKQTGHKRQRAGLAFHKSRVHGLSQEISYVKRVGCTIVGLGSAPAWIGVPSGRGDTSRADRHHEQLLLTIEAVRHKAADTSFHNGTVYVNLYQNAATDS